MINGSRIPLFISALYGILSDSNITPPDIITSGCSTSTSTNNIAIDTAAATRDDMLFEMENRQVILTFVVY